MVIVDPAISVTKGYKAYDDGLKMDVFIKVRVASRMNPALITLKCVGWL